jgi:TolA-binding protein
VKILAKFLLSGVFVFLPAVGCTQDVHGLYNDCGIAPVAMAYEVSSEIVVRLENGQNCLNKNLMELAERIESLHYDLTRNNDLAAESLDLQKKLEQTEDDLRAAKIRIQYLENDIQELKFDSSIERHLVPRVVVASKPAKQSGAQVKPIPPANKTKASNPKGPVSKPTPQ